MGRRLRTHVHVFDERGESHAFGPDDKVPAWAAKQMGDHCWEDEQEPEEVGEQPDVPVPAKNGAGSTADAWAIYAQANGVEVELDAKRDDIIAACEAAGVPTE